METTIEKLTDEERAWLEESADAQGLGPVACAKALRIIDQLTAALEAAELTEKYLRQRLETDILNARADRNLAESRAEALQAEVTRLTAALEAAEARADEERCERVQLEESDNYQAEGLREGNTFLSRELGRANARAEALQARVAELEDAVGWERALKDALLPYQERAVAAESELADLRGRVKRALAEWEPIKRHYRVPMHLCTELEALRGR